MGKAYSILIIEDHPEDAELINLSLQKADLNFNFQIIHSKDQLIVSLGENKYDIVISDYDLPDLTGKEALGIVKKHNSQLPFILVTGYLETKEAIEVVRQGADDFVLKDDLERLGISVIRELINYEETKKREKILQVSYSLAEIGHWELNLKTNELIWSEEVKAIHEVDNDYQPTLEKAIEFYDEGDHRFKIIEVLKNAIKNSEEYEIDALITTAKGKRKWIRTNGKPEVVDGETQLVYGSIQNITEQKATEQKLRDIVEHSTNLFYRHDTNHILTYVSPQSHQFLRCSPEEAIHSWKAFITDHPINRKAVELTKKAIETGKPQPSFRAQMKRMDGELIWVRVNEAPVVHNGKTIAVVGSLTDITELVKSEEKKALLARVAAETRNIVIITDLENKIEWVNDAFEKNTGYDKEEVMGKNPAFLQGPETDPGTIATIKKGLKNRKSIRTEILNYSKSGQANWYRLNITPITNEDGEIVRYFSIREDITKQKNYLDQLTQKRERLQEAQRIGKIGDWDYNLQTGEIIWSDQLFEIIERDPKLGHPSLEEAVSYYQEASEELVKHIENAIENGEEYGIDSKIVTRSGEEKYIQTEGQPIFNKEGDVIHLHGIVQDITQRKEIENDLTEVNKFMDLAIEGSGIGLWELDLDTKETYFSKMYYTMLGYSKDEVRFDKSFHDEIIHPEDDETIEKHMDKILRGIEDQFEETIRLKHKDGSYRWILDRAKVVEYEDGRPKKLAGSHLDITERIKSGLEAITKGRLLKAVSDNVDALLYRYLLKEDGSDQMLYVSDSIEKMYEVTAEEVLDSPDILWSLIHQNDIQNVRDTVKASSESQSRWDCKFRIETKSGKIKWIHGKGNPTKLEDGSCQWDSIAMDITEQVRREEMNEALIQEVHHRTKNNLAIIIGFLEIQLAELDEYRRERLPLERAMTRIYSIAEVHKLLYEGSNFVDIDVDSYLNQLVKHVKTTLRIDQNINIDVKANNLRMSVNELTPLGMLINELLTNSLKYAFEKKDEGRISIHIMQANHTYQVVYKDNGTGIKKSTFHDAETSGLNIVNTLLTQLGADYHFTNENGFCLKFGFKERQKGAHGNLSI